MNFDLLIHKAAQMDKKKIAVASAADPEVLGAVSAAVNMGLAEFLLYGSNEEVNGMIKERYPDLIRNPAIQVLHTHTKERAAELAVKAVRAKEAEVLMKGNIPTSVLLKAVLNKEFGLRTGKVLSHVAVFEVAEFGRFLIVTDAAMNISPNLDQKVQIISNAAAISRSAGIEIPKVAALAAVETINPQMQATLDAAVLTQMNRRGQISDCVIDGPLALDNAISAIAAQQKGIKGEVAGHADILLVPDIEAGNVLYKSLIYFAKARVGAVITGAAAPIVLTSRADSADSKLYSLALAICSTSNKTAFLDLT